MKKIEIERDSVWYKPAFKTLLTMKLIFLLVCGVGLLTSVAEKSYAQSTKLTFSLKNSSIKDVLEHIENHSEFSFMYENNVIDVDAKVDVAANDETIDIILNRLLGDKVEHRVIGRHIVLFPSGPKAGENLPSLYQQQRAVSGTVTDESGEPLPGVTVVVKGTTQGTVTGADGNYSLTNIPGDATLVFSFVGMRTQEVVVANQSNINVTLEQETIGIEEVVAVGYGTLKKSDLTGSVSSVTSDDLANLTISRAEQALIGKMAGVMVKQVSGEPGVSPQILVRGYNSIDKTASPLFVVDGHPIDNINSINPNDIESMDVLKDASATAIYGSRGTNGVILITTKRGKSGVNTINLNIYSGLQFPGKTVDMMNAKEIAQFQYDSFVNRNLDEGNDISGDPLKWKRAVPNIVMDILEGRNTTDTDWQDEVLQSAVPVQSYHLGTNGGTERIDYYISGEYYSQEGLIKNSSFRRYSMRMNINSRVNNWLTIGGTLNPSYTNRDDMETAGRGENLSKSVLSNALIAQPFMPVYDENGEYLNMYGFDGAVNNTNPVAIVELITDNQQAAKITGNMYSEFKLTENLDFKVLFGFLIQNNRNKYFRPQDNAFSEGIPYGSSSTSQTINWINTNTLNYSRIFAEVHNLDFLLGYEIQHDMFENNSLNSNKYPNNLIQTLNVASAIDAGSSFEREWTLLSYIGRINYNYMDKYYLTTSLRRDGSSRFGSENKWGWFPSAAIAWRVSNENFMEDLSSVSNLKLRASYGITGNNNIGDYLYIPTISYDNYVLGNNLAPGYHPNRIANPFLHWEQQEEINLGLDIGVLNNRVNLSTDYFIKKNENLLLNVQIPAITGFTNTTTNIGTIQNKGWEFALTSQNLIGKLNWTTNFNLSLYRNKVLALGPEGDDILTSNHITRIGEPVGMFFGYLTDGVIMNHQELQDAPIFNPGGTRETRVGDFRFKDLSGPGGIPDGIIDANDRTIMGNPHPDFIYGMTNNLSFGNFDLEIALHGLYGNDIMYGIRNYITNTRGRRNQMAIMNDYWKSEEDPGNGKIPRPNHNPTGNNRGWSDFYVENGSFLRVSNITLGYQLSKHLTDRMRIQRFRIYMTAMNPFTFTKYSGYNPDVSNNASPLTPGEDWNNYPLPRTISLGVNVSL